jgi:hypothetical protein
MWCLFGYYWYVVARRQINLASLEAMGVLALITLVGMLVTIWWIAHNKRLASRNRRQNAPPVAAELFTRDVLGRPLAGPGVDLLRAAGTVTVTIDDEGRKVYAVAEGVGN